MEKVFKINGTRIDSWMTTRGLLEGDTRQFDSAVRLFVHTHSSAGLTACMRFVTLFGSPLFVSIAALAVAVVAVSSALIMGAPATMMGVALNLNPGPAIIGAASVPPSFMEPSKGH